MHRSLRMLEIIMRLQQGGSTLGELADKFECSTKSIQRDLDEMLSIGIPVITMRGRNGGVSIDSSWWLGPMNLTADEIETIILAMENASFLPGQDSVLAKVRAAVQPSRFDSIVDDDSLPQITQRVESQPTTTLPGVRKIIARGLWCRIDYQGGSNPGWRTILPRQLQIADQRWYLAAVDERSRESRTFRVDRIIAIEPTLGPADADRIIEHAQRQPEYHSTSYPEVVAELTDAGVTFCKDHPRLRACLANGMLRFHCPPSDYTYMARDLMRMGINCRVIAPNELIQEMRTITQEMIEHLGR